MFHSPFQAFSAFLAGAEHTLKAKQRLRESPRTRQPKIKNISLFASLRALRAFAISSHPPQTRHDRFSLSLSCRNDYDREP
jgi:hypothetical protein